MKVKKGEKKGKGVMECERVIGFAPVWALQGNLRLIGVVGNIRSIPNLMRTEWHIVRFVGKENISLCLKRQGIGGFIR